MDKKRLISYLTFEIIFFISFIIRIVLNATNVLSIKPFDFVFDIVLLILVWVVPIFEKIFKIKLNFICIVLYLIFITASTFIGTIWGMYNIWYLYDFFTHLISSCLIAIIVYNIFISFKSNQNIKLVWLFFIVFSLTMACGCLWEIWEFSVDRLLGLNTQRFQDIQGNDFIGYRALIDTMTDIIANFIGAVVGSCVSVILNKNREGNMHTIVLASTNEGKIKEFSKALPEYNILTLKDIGFNSEIEETGETFEQNAMIKALTVRKFLDDKGLKYAVLADDSGLCVNALNGEPGVYTARYADDHNAEKNREKLLKNLKDKKDRSAYFECCLILIDSNKHCYKANGRVHGEILKQETGDKSFAYDCLFYSNDLKECFGNCTTKQKNSVSHRGRAIQDMIKQIKDKNFIKI